MHTGPVVPLLALRAISSDTRCQPSSLSVASRAASDTVRWWTGEHRLLVPGTMGGGCGVTVLTGVVLVTERLKGLTIRH